MSITNRLSLFFLAALGLVLAGFSLTLYLLANRHLHHQTDHRLDDAMQTLVAAIEVHPTDVEWEPLERRITMGEGAGLHQVRWTVHGPGGRLVDRSVNLDHPPDVDGAWRLQVRQVRAGKFEVEPVAGRPERILGTLREAFPGAKLPGEILLPRDRTFHGDALVLTVALSEEPAHATLRLLALSMIGVSGFIWLTAAFWGRWLCRRALSPVFSMAASARSIRRQLNAPAFLDVPPTEDELAALGRDFNDLLADLRESLERQRRFAGDASHQLRTPLAAMLGKVDVALRKDRNAADYREALLAVRRRGEQLQQIIESLLFLARAEAEAPLPNAKVLDLRSWCHSWLEGWHDHVRGTDITFRIGDGSALVETQPALVGQVLDNLLDNACKYSEPGTPITVSVEQRQGRTALAVTDRGCGIELDELARIHQPFYRSRQARWLGKPGIGLGLTIVERLVLMIGGKLEVISEPGKGSEFCVIFPHAGTTAESGGTAEPAQMVDRSQSEVVGSSGYADLEERLIRHEEK
jgi:signal transduction histidine kinase